MIIGGLLRSIYVTLPVTGLIVPMSIALHARIGHVQRGGNKPTQGLASGALSVVQALDHAWTETMPDSLPDPITTVPDTAERVLVHADSSVHPDLLNSRFGYVSISRASHEATLFTDDLAKLGPQLGADVSKTSALEINQTSSIAQGIGLGL